jgi:hypothetical protein
MTMTNSAVANSATVRDRSLKSSTTASRPATNAALMTIRVFFGAHAPLIKTATAPSAPRNIASETPIACQSQNSQSASATQAAADASGIISGRAGVGAISKSDAVAIDMVLLPGMDEGEVSDLASGPGRVALRQRDDGRSNRRGCQPPGIAEQPPWQSGSPESNADDLRHGRTVPGRLAVRLLSLLRNCGFSCRFYAEALTVIPGCAPRNDGQ